MRQSATVKLVILRFLLLFVKNIQLEMTSGRFINIERLFMKNNIKAIFLVLVVSIGVVPAVFADEVDTTDVQKKEPFVFTQGVDTVVMAGALPIIIHYKREKGFYEESTEYPYFDGMNKILLFSTDGQGSVEEIMTLGQLRAIHHDEEQALLGQEGEKLSQLAEDVKVKMDNNQAVLCPQTVFEYVVSKGIFWDTKNKVERPLAILLYKKGIEPNCNDCDELLTKYFEERAKKGK